MKKSRKITVNALTRVEGEGALYIRLDGNQIEDVQLSIYEPPRFFEAFLRGRSVEEVPDITARICGICPIAYQMTTVHALENALGVVISPEIRCLRRLLYCGEWIESHVLHIYMLNAPDFFDCHSGIELAKKFPDQVNRGLRMKKIGNTLLEVLGGRAIHPVNVRVGGFHRSPRHSELAALLPDLQWALEASVQSARWISTFDFPEFSEDCEFVALQHPGEYPMNEGSIASSKYDAIDVRDYDSTFIEQQVSHSTALQSSRRDTDLPYNLGPLSRVNLNFQQLYPTARALAEEICPELPMRNRFHAIIARSLEVVHAFEEAIAIIKSYTFPAAPFIKYSYCQGYGVAATEAPRGMIYHSYQTTPTGQIGSSNIVPPTSQNQRQIESDLRKYLPQLLCEDDTLIANECEKLIRTYDPCISCSTHFLELTVERT